MSSSYFKWKLHVSGPLMDLVGTPVVGANYHVRWGLSKGVVGKCYEVDPVNRIVKLKTPSTNKPFKNNVKWDDLQHTRRQEYFARKGKNPYQ